MAKNKDTDNAKVERLSDEEVAEVEAQMENDLSRTGRDRTKAETKTEVEDRTEAPAQRPKVEYEAEDTELDGGTILTSYGAAKEVR